MGARSGRLPSPVCLSNAGALLPSSVEEPEVRVLYDPTEGSIDCELFNPGLMPLTFVVSVNAYFDDAPAEVTVAPFATNVHMWNLHRALPLVRLFRARARTARFRAALRRTGGDGARRHQRSGGLSGRSTRTKLAAVD
ncbi:hypothetical protein LP420_25800 [Massilia sp. B-10]|nr:hypothetical protein LP420_25800 [Massilia sp. B-10]